MKINEKIQKIIPSILLLLILITISSTAVAKKGDLPNGQPFQAIKTQLEDLQVDVIDIKSSILEMKEQLEQLVVDTESLEERIFLNEQFIDEIAAENLLIKSQVDDIIETAEINGQQIDLNSQEIQSLILQFQINSAKIEYLESEVTELNSEMEGKQANMVDQCPSGWAINAISAEGIVTCEYIYQPSANGETNVSFQIKSLNIAIPDSTRSCTWDMGPLGCWGYSRWSTPSVSEEIMCDDGFIPTGAGFRRNYDNVINMLEGHDFDVHRYQIKNNNPIENGWYVTVKRGPSFYGLTNELIIDVICLKME